mmetsp:Transcript_2103/g.13667  ORF Transcript_2103/g.13667 Transcript_2103/m.13667 type:complete len:441 (+) Transcript_2103:5167-6489(+)
MSFVPDLFTALACEFLSMYMFVLASACAAFICSLCQRPCALSRFASWPFPATYAWVACWKYAFLNLACSLASTRESAYRFVTASPVSSHGTAAPVPFELPPAQAGLLRFGGSLAWTRCTLAPCLAAPTKLWPCWPASSRTGKDDVPFSPRLGKLRSFSAGATAVGTFMHDESSSNSNWVSTSTHLAMSKSLASSILHRLSTSKVGNSAVSISKISLSLIPSAKNPALPRPSSAPSDLGEDSAVRTSSSACCICLHPPRLSPLFVLDFGLNSHAFGLSPRAKLDAANERGCAGEASGCSFASAARKATVGFLPNHFLARKKNPSSASLSTALPVTAFKTSAAAQKASSLLSSAAADTMTLVAYSSSGSSSSADAPCSTRNGSSWLRMWASSKASFRPANITRAPWQSEHRWVHRCSFHLLLSFTLVRGTQAFLSILCRKHG